MVNFFDVVVFLLSSLGTGSSFMSTSSLALELWQLLFIMGLTRNLEIGNIPIWILSNIWRLGQVRDTKFDMNVSNEKLLSAANCQIYSFYCFLVNKGGPTVG